MEERKQVITFMPDRQSVETAWNEGKTIMINGELKSRLKLAREANLLPTDPTISTLAPVLSSLYFHISSLIVECEK